MQLPPENRSFAAQPPVADGGKRIFDLVAKGQFGQARLRLRQQVTGRPDRILHIAHLEGLILVHQRKPEEAIRVFRTILSAKPNFTPSRLALARTLLLTGDTEASQFHFENLADGANDSDLQKFATRALRAIRENRTYGASFHFSFLPSTNVNRGTSNRTIAVGNHEFTIDDDSRETSGLGVSVGVRGFKSHKLDRDNKLVARASVTSKIYHDTDDYDDTSFSAGLALQRRLGQLSVSIGPTFAYKFAAQEPYLFSFGIAGGAKMAIGTRNQIGLGLSAVKQNYVDLDYRDGSKFTGSLSWQRMLSPSLRFTNVIGFEIERTDSDHLDHNDLLFKTQVDQEWRGGLLTSIFAFYQPSRYLGDFPTTNSKRRDDEYSIGTRVAHRSFSFRGFAPQLTYQYTNQTSNVSFYEFHSHDVGLSLTRKF